MFVSGKLSKTVLVFLERQSESTDELLVDFEAQPGFVSSEILRDPSAWIPVEQFESLLNSVTRRPWRKSYESLLVQIATSAFEYRTWGVLDQVLRILPQPHDVWRDPHQLLGHFISPRPSLTQVVVHAQSVEFQWVHSWQAAPLTQSFFSSLLESVSLFFGKPISICRWTQNSLKIDWSHETPLPFLESPESAVAHVSPLLAQEIAQALEKQHQDLQSQSEALRQLRHNLSALKDYFVRSQQLITLLMGSHRDRLDVQEAMKRVNWEQVQDRFPILAEESDRLLMQVSPKKLRQEINHVEN